MRTAAIDSNIFDTKSIWKILYKTAPPVMLAQLIQALYNIVDSFFIGKYSEDGLTALSVIFPIQLIIIAIATGTGVGVNTQMSRYYAYNDLKRANRTAGTGIVLAVFSWLIFVIASIFFMRPYVMTSASSPAAIEYAVTYGNIVCIGSIGVFLESIWSKVHQASGNMKLPMYAQIAGAAANMILDPILIFGVGFIPEMGIAGAAYATVAGQIVAAIITRSAYRTAPERKEFITYTKQIYKLGYPSILMQALYTVYIVVLNIILAGFSDAAVTVLGLYYKMQTFFFIPFNGLQTCVVPLLSYTFAKKDYPRCKLIMKDVIILTTAFMLICTVCFELIPRQLLSIFSSSEEVFTIGAVALRIIGVSYLFIGFSLMLPVFFQAIGKAMPSVILSVTRQLICLAPIFWLLSLIGLDYAWMSFPISELITCIIGVILYIKETRLWEKEALTDSK